MTITIMASIDFRKDYGFASPVKERNPPFIKKRYLNKSFSDLNY